MHNKKENLLSAKLTCINLNKLQDIIIKQTEEVETTKSLCLQTDNNLNWK
jgi:hypothetical protein